MDSFIRTISGLLLLLTISGGCVTGNAPLSSMETWARRSELLPDPLARVEGSYWNFVLVNAEDGRAGDPTPFWTRLTDLPSDPDDRIRMRLLDNRTLEISLMSLGAVIATRRFRFTEKERHLKLPNRFHLRMPCFPIIWGGETTSYALGFTDEAMHLYTRGKGGVGQEVSHFEHISTNTIAMDTDYLTPMAYACISLADEASDVLKSEIGAAHIRAWRSPCVSTHCRPPHCTANPPCRTLRALAAKFVRYAG